MINSVTLIGNVGKQPEVKRLEGDRVVASFSVATNESYKDKNGEWQTQTEWHSINCWGRLAEYAEKNLGSGKLVYVEGKLRTRSWDTQSGEKRYKTEISAKTIRLLEKREQKEESPFPPAEASNQSAYPADIPF